MTTGRHARRVAVRAAQHNTPLVPRLRLGTHCLGGSASRGRASAQCVPRQSLGTRSSEALLTTSGRTLTTNAGRSGGRFHPESKEQDHVRKGAPPTTILLAGNKDELHPLTSALGGTATHEVIEADDAVDALSLLRRELADVAVFDLTVDGADGAEILRAVQGLPRPVPVIFFTDSHDVGYALELMRAGAADYFVKPVSAAALQQAVDRIERSQAPSPPLAHAGSAAVPSGNGVPQHAQDAQVRRAHRLEALGRLMDAVAHDLNNQMTVLLGFSSLVRSVLPADDPLRRHIDEIYHAAERSGALSRQLLEYGREREQELAVIDINLLLAGMVNMIERLLGGRIEFATALKARPALVKADLARCSASS